MPMFFNIDGVRIEESQVKEYLEKKKKREKAQEKKDSKPVQKPANTIQTQAPKEIVDKNLVFNKNK